MAKTSEVDLAITAIDAEIADLMRVKDRLVAAKITASTTPSGAPKAKRGRKKKTGLPEQSSGD